MTAAAPQDPDQAVEAGNDNAPIDDDDDDDNLRPQVDDFSALPKLPSWVNERKTTWGEPLEVKEWQEDGGLYRDKHGWKGRDLIHDVHAPVRILDYHVQYGNGDGIIDPSVQTGGIGTTLTGICHFTPRAESHPGYCHGGSMCSVLDDVIGWVAFLTTGKCNPWSGFTVQINTNLCKPIAVHSILQVQAKIVNVERRKVSVQASISDPAGEDIVHATGDGLVIINRGVLPGDNNEQSA